MHPKFIEECLVLSSGRELHVELQVSAADNVTVFKQNAIKAIIQPASSTRWISLVLRANIAGGVSLVEYPYTHPMDFVHNMYSNRGRLHVPNLTSLSLVHALEKYETSTYTGSGPELPRFAYWFEEMYNT